MSQQSAVQRRVPNVDREWADDFIVELRLRGASGAAIGSALLEVESHMAEHGGDVTAAFGPARTYAASLDLPDTQRFTRAEIAWMAIRSGLATLGVWLAIAGSLSAVTGRPATLSLVTAVALAAGTAVVAVLFARHSEAVLRWFVDHLVLGAVAVAIAAAAIGLLAALGALVPPLATEAPAVVALVAGLVLLGAALVWWRLDRRSGPAADDEIVFPVD